MKSIVYHLFKTLNMYVFYLIFYRNISKMKLLKKKVILEIVMHYFLIR